LKRRVGMLLTLALAGSSALGTPRADGAVGVVAPAPTPAPPPSLPDAAVRHAGEDSVEAGSPSGSFAHEGPADWNAGVPEQEPGCEETLTRAAVVFQPAQLPAHLEHGMRCGAPAFAGHEGRLD
jgi:hypothetical protein